MIPSTANFQAANLNSNPSKTPVLALEIVGYARVFTNYNDGVGGHYPWITSVDDHQTDASDLDGSSSLNDLNVYVLDLNGAITADLAGATLEGKKAVLKIGFAGLAYGDFATLFTGIVTAIPMSDNDTVYVFTLHDSRQDLAAVIYQVGDDGQPTGSDHPRTVDGNPMDILLDVLENEVGIAPGDIDVTKITNYRDQVFAGMEFDFSLTSAPDALQFIHNQIMKPLGGYLRTTWDGKITVQFFTPLPGTNTTVAALTDHNIVGLPIPLQADLVNVLSTRFDSDGNDWLSEDVEIDSDSETKYGQQGQHIIESDGMRSAFQGFMIAAQTAQAIFFRYGDKNPMLDPVTVLWSMCLLEQGDLVTVSHPLVPDRKAGTIGWVNKTFEVLKRTWKFSGEFTVDLTLVDGTGAIAGGSFRITTDAEPVWTVASAGDKATLMFQSDPTGHYSDASPANAFA